MKIIFVTHCFDPVKDGGSRLLSSLAYYTASQKEKVEVITSNRLSGDDFFKFPAKTISPAREIKKGVVIRRLKVFPWGRKIIRLFYKLTQIDFFLTLNLGPLFWGREIWKKGRADWVVAGPYPRLSPFWGWWLAKLNRAQLALIPCFHFGEKEFESRFLKSFLFKADLIFCLTKKEKEAFAAWGIKRKKLVVLGGAVDDFVFRFRRDEAGFFPKVPMVLFLGVQAEHKRIPLLIRAMRRVWRRRPVDLIIAGPHCASSFLVKSALASLSLKERKRVTWLGEVSEEKKIILFDRATLLVNPSRFESWGIVIAEAWARKKPVVAADLPVFQELITSGKDGLIFKGHDPLDLAAKILFLTEHPREAKRMGENGYNKVINRWTSKKTGARFIKTLRKRRGCF